MVQAKWTKLGRELAAAYLSTAGVINMVGFDSATA
jgi:hypothetical protein